MNQVAVIRSEWTKLWSLRSTRRSLFAACLALASLGAFAAVSDMNNWESLPADWKAGYDGSETSVVGFHLAQLAVGVLGVLTLSGEYATGMIRSTLMAVPRRLPVLWAKVATFAGATFVLMLAAALIAFFVTQPILAEHDVDRTLGDPDALRIVVGTALYLTALGVLAIGLGGMSRSSAGGIAAFFALVLVVPEVAGLLPGGLAENVGPYLPSNAGQALTFADTTDGTLAPWPGFLVLVAWAAAGVGGAAVMLTRKDA
jgi:hypothetical protein